MAEILLPQRTGGGIARIGKDLFTRRFLPLIERQKSRLGHVDLAAHLADRRHVFTLELVRHVLERADIGGDVLTFGTITTGGGSDEFSTFIAQRHREAVDLRFGAESDFFVLGQFEEAANASDEIDYVLFGKCVVERKHRHRVPDLLEFSGRSRSDAT